MYYKALFMEDQNYPNHSLEEVKDIKRLMERSRRFISLSGLSGVAAGICALAGSWIATTLLAAFKKNIAKENYRGEAIDDLTRELIVLAIGVFVAAMAFSYLFTWRRARKQQLPVWDYTSRKLLWNMIIPLAAGGLFIWGMLQYGEWRFVAPACLVFYGLALVNASKYTLTDIRYLGYFEIILGIISMWFIGYGLIFWAIGFGVMHIVYGVIMWWKYEKGK